MTKNKTKKIASLGIFVCCWILVACISHLYHWEQDYSLAHSALLVEMYDYQNMMGSLGFHVAFLFMDRLFGLGGMLFVIQMGLMSFAYYRGIHIRFLQRFLSILYSVFFFALFLSLFSPSRSWVNGELGQSAYHILRQLIGIYGVIAVIAFYSFISIKYNLKFVLRDLLRMFSAKYRAFIKNRSQGQELNQATLPTEQEPIPYQPTHKIDYDHSIDQEITPKAIEEDENVPELDNLTPEPIIESVEEDIQQEIHKSEEQKNILSEVIPQLDLQPEPIEVPVEPAVPNQYVSPSTREDETPPQEDEIKVEVTENKEDQLDKIHHRGDIDSMYDPRLELSNYQFPSLDLLDTYDLEEKSVSDEEIEKNKKRIVEVLGHYKVVVVKIKATVGPTITLYEIVPKQGTKVSKVRSLEDDIAMSLAAIGIRIIAPIPGKGTIGIEVPNENPLMVHMSEVLASKKFASETKMNLPVAMGKTITGETYMFDLAKAPHLLMAGATGQGKSVGLNVMLACLLYKKHPSELKFVMVDPKKVELSLYSQIERHYLAKLPEEESAILTDTSKVIHTLNSLCIEMDTRYKILKDAKAKTIIEYNDKFKARKLNPTEGHRFMPYIVVVIDEFADLIMTAGKEIETPIARIAQLARAVGIHLIVATQRPSANVITGTIKANFPTRVAFRVSSSIDSRTILDSKGAESLIGRGDMLYNSGQELIRVQSAFVDTHEIENLCNFIGEQQGYATAFDLPEYVPEAEESDNMVDSRGKRDTRFEEAARLVVAEQKASTTWLQTVMSMGYAKAARITLELESAKIIGPADGSKKRRILVSTMDELEQLLNNLD